MVRAPPGVTAPVPPLAIESAFVSVRPAKVGDEVVAMFCGNESVSVPLPVTFIWLAVPTKLFTDVVATSCPALTDKPAPSPIVPVKPAMEFTKLGTPVTWLKLILPLIMVPV